MGCYYHILKVWTLLLLFFLSYTAFGQTEAQMDSAEFVAKSAKTDSAAVAELVAWDDLIFEEDSELDLYLNELIQEICEANIGPLEHIQESVFSTALSFSYENQGIYYQDLGDIPRCLTFYEKLLGLEQALLKNNTSDERTSRMAASLLTIGTVHAEGEGLAVSEEYFREALTLVTKVKDTVLMAQCYSNIAFAQANMRLTAAAELKDSLFAEALKNNKLGLELQLALQNKVEIAISYNNIGVLYSKKPDLDSAIVYAEKSLAVSRENGDKRGVTYSLSNIATAYFNLEKMSLAETYADSALKLAQELGYPIEIKGPATLLYKINKLNGEWRDALTMHELSVEMGEKLRNEDSRRLLLEQKAKYEFDKKEAVLKEKEKVDAAQIETQQALIENQEQRQLYFVVGIVMILCFLVFVFLRWRKSIQQNRIIAEQKDDLQEAHENLEEKNGEILASIQYAKRIQTAILPPRRIVKEYIEDSFILYKPKDIVAGDFYWLEHVGGKTLFAAADCTGHGVPGAMVSVLCNNGLNRSVREYGLTDPGKVLDKTREIVIAEFEKSEEEVKDGMDIALCCLDGMNLQFAGAHNPLWIIRNDEILEFKGDKQPIGKFEYGAAFTTHNIELQKGDMLYVFSDGYADQFGGEKGKKLKSGNFKKLLLAVHKRPIDEQRSVIDKAFEDWKGDLEQIDDVCVIGVRV